MQLRTKHFWYSRSWSSCFGDLPVSHEAKVAYKLWLTEESEFKPTSDVLEHLENLEERYDLLKIKDFDTLYQNNNEWEEFCIKRNVNPVEAWWLFKNANMLPPRRIQMLTFEPITDVIRIEREIMERSHSAAQFPQICQLLCCGLEKYLQERFLQQLSNHLNLFIYLPKTPFVWHLSSEPHHAIVLYITSTSGDVMPCIVSVLSMQPTVRLPFMIVSTPLTPATLSGEWKYRNFVPH